MKKGVLLLVMMVVTMISFTALAQDKKDKKKNKEEVVFDVSMTCESCKKRIEKNIPFEKGVSDLKVNLPAKTVMIVYQSDKTNQDKLQKALEKMGYEVFVHQEEAEK